MAKQTQLRHLLDELVKKVRLHQALCHDHTATSEQRQGAFDAAEITEKRIFSWFDALNQELAVKTRLNTERMAAIGALTRQIEQMTGTGQPVQKFEPFDLKRAQAGDAIEVRVITTHNNEASRYDWHAARFIGVRSGGSVMVETGASAWAIEVQAPSVALRMASKTQDIQMFANVFIRPGASGQCGALYKTEEAARRASGINPLGNSGSAIPVTVTVAK